MKEFEAVVGPCNSEQEIIEKGRQLLANYHIETLLITRGEAAMTLIEADSTSHFLDVGKESPVWILAEFR
jgi:D-beta-D-heptose 7-phosphate kinase/D-beta-D-heptose 1-phosphate adenosyltransferase